MDDSLYAVLKVQYIFNMAQWLSWLERRPVTAEVESSSLFWVVFKEKKIVYSGILAQLGEHLPYKQRVTGSSPVGPIDLSEYGGIAQLARAHGSYPWCRWFKSSFRYEERGLNFRSLLFFCSKSFG